MTWSHSARRMSKRSTSRSRTSAGEGEDLSVRPCKKRFRENLRSFYPFRKDLDTPVFSDYSLVPLPGDKLFSETGLLEQARYFLMRKDFPHSSNFRLPRSKITDSTSVIPA